ncbi:protein FAR1-RELATED SEQUENCE 5 isoform X8 [Panicum virgatum]|uniref:protein FAR1-RELATED SEQUENCE 5 isoform X8 n=1 Tax=Panicum virgatum TaxID=38727 RepID=UPI0019D540F5|nr:protein FAR1-RELATED SEQUENCE 5 isoform X8 [Panicum virgatum]
MKAEKVREERDDDLNKLLQFFRECKENNEHFYWDVDADPKTRLLKNIFWSHASQRAEYRDFGDVITFDMTHKTNSKHMPLAMFVGANNKLKNVSFGKAMIGDETTGSFKWLFETFKNCMGGRQPYVILTDEDPAMRQAIGMVLDRTQHRNCRWHILRLWEYELDHLYVQHKNKNLKERLESLINYPLGPMQFEIERIRLVHECGIAENPTIKVLWDKRERWIVAYFKGMYCGRMTSTQRSESQNKVLKDGYVNESTSMHMFAKRMLDTLRHADHMDAGETHYAQAELVRACKAKFDEQLSRLYTRAVYQEYKKQYNNSTTFVTEPNPDPRVKNGWLVKHENGEGSFCWAQHEFKVVADKEAGEYSCECKQWEHIGLFCMHIIRAFTQLQVRKIPEKYILKRYTRDAREEVMWDRHDGVRIGAQASKEQCRTSKLLPKLMRLGKVGSKSDRAYEETNRQLDKITPGIELFPISADDESSDPAPSSNGSAVTSGGADTNSPPSSALLHAGVLLIEPPVSRTKGRAWKTKEK